MRVFITVLVLIFSFQSFTKADDIRDFEIEGMSLGDSALNFFTESHIKKNTWDYYNDKTFTPVQNDKLPFFKTYDAVDFNYKTGDTEYIIYHLNGVLYFDKNIKDCYPKMEEIFEQLSDFFTDAKILEKQVSYAPWDKKSKKTSYDFEFDSGYISVACYEYSKESPDMDHLAVELFNSEFRIWRSDKAYK